MKGQVAKTASGEPTVLGKDWLSVAVLPASAVSGISARATPRSWWARPRQGAAGGSAGAMSGPGAGAAILGALLQAATPVHGAWGSGRLLHTSLVSVLILDGSGKVLVGSVTPPSCTATRRRSSE